MGGSGSRDSQVGVLEFRSPHAGQTPRSQALSNTVWALSKLEVETRDSALLDAVAATILPALPDFNAQNIANTVRLIDSTAACGVRGAPSVMMHHSLRSAPRSICLIGSPSL